LSVRAVEAEARSPRRPARPRAVSPRRAPRGGSPEGTRDPLLLRVRVRRRIHARRAPRGPERAVRAGRRRALRLRPRPGRIRRGRGEGPRIVPPRRSLRGGAEPDLPRAMRVVAVHHLPAPARAEPGALRALLEPG